MIKVAFAEVFVGALAALLYMFAVHKGSVQWCLLFLIVAI